MKSTLLSALIVGVRMRRLGQSDSEDVELEPLRLVCLQL